MGGKGSERYGAENGESLLLTSIPQSERRRIETLLEPIRLETDHVLAEFDKPLDYVWFLHDCVTSTVVPTEDGSFLEVGLMGADGLAGLSLLLGEAVSNATVVVQIAGNASRMRAEHFTKEVVEYGGPLLRLISRYCNAFMAMIAQSAVCNSMHPIDARMCRWILMTHDRVKRDEFALTERFLGMMLGVRRGAVAATAATLQQAGMIDHTVRSITVLDRDRLEDGACDCYGIINQQLSRVFQRQTTNLTDWQD